MARGDEHEFEVEPVPGLPGALPKGEGVLWQGRPNALALARAALWLDWVAGYFVVLAVWRVGVSSIDFGWAAIGLAVPFLGMGLAACGLLYLIAWVQARATVYTITTHRVAMRIGAALTLTVNLPMPKIAAADLALSPNGTGTIALSTTGQTRLSYAVLWPHIRPWHLKDVKPALRCIPDAPNVAAILANAVEGERTRPEIALRTDLVAAE